MDTAPPENRPGQDILASREAGGKAIRGGAMRTVGYGAGLVLGLASAPLLTRHLGVVDFGRYVTVTSLIAIIGLITDAGLTAVAVREASVRDTRGQRRLMENVVTLRLLASTVGALVAICFAAAAGYESPLVAGTLVAGVGLIITSAQQAYTIMLIVQLRQGLLTLLELLRQALTVVAIVILVLTGAGLLPFFAATIPAGLVVLALTLVVKQDVGTMRPRFDRGEISYLLRESVPAAAAGALNSVFYRLAIIVMSLVAVETETGLFSASFRIMEALIGIPALAIGAAAPILARAAATDWERLRYAHQQLFDMSVILGALMAVTVAVAARPAIDVIAGAQYHDAIPVLRIQGIALAATFLVRLWGTSLWVVRANRELVAALAFAVAVAIALTAILAASNGAMGAALAMVISEVLLATALATALFIKHPDLRPRLRVVPKVLVAVTAASIGAAAGLPPVAALAVALPVYTAVLLVLGGIPPDLRRAVLRPASLSADD